jgi:DNA-binding NarL/FixJ family response regulator
MMARPAMIRIGIVDDHAMVREGLRRFLADQAGFAVTAEAANGDEALDMVRRRGVDVIVLDVAMPGLNGIDVLIGIRAHAPALPVLIFSGFAEAHYASTLMRHGASGYLNKGCDPDEIALAIRALARGRKYVAGAMGGSRASMPAGGLPGTDAVSPHEQLSSRELQVFLRLARGEALGHVAASLSLSGKTISTYRARVMEKLALASNADLTGYALRNGLIA